MPLASVLGIVTFLAGTFCAAMLFYALPQRHRWMLVLLVFSICYIKKPFYQEVFYIPYRGVDRGFGVTVPDLIFFGYFLCALIGGIRRRVIWMPYNSLPWLLITLVACCSLGVSRQPLYSLFTIHKFIRCFVLYWAVVNLIRSRDDVVSVVNTFIAVVLFEVVVVFWNKYVTGAVVYRAMGTFKHPNSLAMYIGALMLVFTSVLLSGHLSRRWRLAGLTAVLGGFCVVLFTKSRASILLVPAMIGLVTTVSILLKPTRRKIMLTAGGIMVFGLVIGIALPKLISRFENAPEESGATRVYFNQAARVMSVSSLFGVGINMYSWMLEYTDYYWIVYADKLDEPDSEAFRDSDFGKSRLGTVHNIYYLYAAETGWIGLGLFILFVLRFFLSGFRRLFTVHDPYYQAVILGLLVALAALFIQGFLEWFLRMTDGMYLLFLLFGMLTAVCRLNTVDTR